MIQGLRLIICKNDLSSVWASFKTTSGAWLGSSFTVRLELGPVVKTETFPGDEEAKFSLAASDFTDVSPGLYPMQMSFDNGAEDLTFLQGVVFVTEEPIGGSYPQAEVQTEMVRTDDTRAVITVEPKGGCAWMSDPSIPILTVKGETGATGPGIATGGTTGQLLQKASSTNFDTSWITPTKTLVGLGNVDNTTDLGKPISTATQTALNGKVGLAGAETITGTKTFNATPIFTTGINFGQSTLGFYEFGSWTLGLTAGGTPATINNLSTTYVRIGNLVTVTSQFSIASFNGGAGAVVLTGFPFTTAGASGGFFAYAFNRTMTISAGGGSTAFAVFSNGFAADHNNFVTDISDTYTVTATYRCQ